MTKPEVGELVKRVVGGFYAQTAEWDVARIVEVWSQELEDLPAVDANAGYTAWLRREPHRFPPNVSEILAWGRAEHRARLGRARCAAAEERMANWGSKAEPS